MKRLLWFSAFILSISSATAETGANPKATTPKSTAKRSAAPARVSAKEVRSSAMPWPHSKSNPTSSANNLTRPSPPYLKRMQFDLIYSF